MQAPDDLFLTEATVNMAALTRLPPGAAVPDDGWVDCAFSTETHRYRRPKQSSYLGKGATADVFW